MADSDVDAGSDVDDGEPGFDPKQDMSKLTDKQRKKLEKNVSQWRIFVDFLVRHVAIATFRYNCFEVEELTAFMIAMEKAETLRSTIKLKKGESVEITSFKTMKETTELLVKHKYIPEAARIKNFLDLCGRMRGIGMIASGFYKALKKGKVKGLDKIKYYLDFWKGFCVRSFNFSEMGFKNADIDSFNALERKYLVWPTSVRTAINLSQKFLKKCSEATGLDLMSPDPRTIQKHMQAAEFVVAAKLEEHLFQRVVQETKSFLLGTPLVQQDQQNSKTAKYELPNIEDMDQALIKPIDDNSMLLQLPESPPAEKKKKKKGKGKKSGKKSGSAKKKKKK